MRANGALVAAVVALTGCADTLADNATFAAARAASFSFNLSCEWAAIQAEVLRSYKHPDGRVYVVRASGCGRAKVYELQCGHYPPGACTFLPDGPLRLHREGYR